MGVPSSAFVVDGDRVRVHLDPRTVPAAFVDPGGLVTLNVHYENGVLGLVGDRLLTVRAAWLGTRPSWLDPGEHVPSLRTDPTSPMPRATEAALSRKLDGQYMADRLALLAPRIVMVPVKAPKGMPLASRTDIRLMSASADPVGGLGYKACKYVDRFTHRWATVGTSYPLSGSRSWLTYSASSASSFGAAVSYNKGVSFSSGGTRTTSDEWDQEFARRNWNRSYRVQVRYQRMHCNEYYGGRFVREISRHWVPRFQTGGTQEHQPDSKPVFRNCAPIAAGTWTRGGTRYTDYTLSYGVKFKDVIGIDLSSRRSYTNGASLKYSNDRRRWACGNNDFPSRAGKIREARSDL